MASFLVRTDDYTASKIKEEAKMLGLSISDYVVSRLRDNRGVHYIPGGYEGTDKQSLYACIIRMKALWFFQKREEYENDTCWPTVVKREDLDSLNYVLTMRLDELIDTVLEIDDENHTFARIVNYWQNVIGSMNMAPKFDIPTDINVSSYETRAIIWGLLNGKLTDLDALEMLLVGGMDDIKDDIVKEYSKTKEGKKGKNHD